MQDQMKQERETAETKGITVTVNGGMESVQIILNPALRQCINDAMQSIQKRIAKMMMASGMGF